MGFTTETDPASAGAPVAGSMNPASAGSYHRSYSQLNQVRTCGYAFQLARIEKRPERPNIPAVMGRVFHTVSEEIDRLIHDQTHRGRGPVQGTNQLVKAVESLTSKTLVAETESTIAGYGPIEDWLSYGKQDYAAWRDTILPRTITNYVDWRLASGYQLVDLPGFGPAIEVPFLIDLGGVVVKGYVDRVFEMNDTPLILDLKSGRKPETIEQLAIYRIALETIVPTRLQMGRVCV
jgi:putative RecB family exonuclease